MAKFEFTTPAGERYEVDAPDEAAAIAAWQSQQPAKVPRTGSAALGVVGGAAQVGKALTEVSPLEDVVRSVGSHLVSATAGIPAIPGDLLDFGATAANWAQGQLQVPEKERVDPAFFQKAPVSSALPRRADTDKFVEDQTGWRPWESQTDIGNRAGQIADFVPGALAGGLLGGLRSAGTAAVKYGVFPGATSMVGGDLAAGAYGEDYRPAGQVAGALGGPLVAKAGKTVATPFPAAPGRIAAADTLERAGVDSLTPGQITGNPQLRQLEGELGGSKLSGMIDTQKDQFTGAVLSKAGMDDSAKLGLQKLSATRGGQPLNPNLATPEVVNFLYDRNSAKFDAVKARNNLQFDQRFAQDLSQARTDYNNLVSPASPSRAPAVDGFAKEIRDKILQPQVTGTEYQNLRSRIAKVARSTSDAATKEVLNEYVAALDNAMERSIASSGNTADLGVFRAARTEYRNLLVLDRAATATGGDAAIGVITPAKLHAAVQAVSGKRAYARGRTDFDELARAGETSMQPIPRIDTAARTTAKVAATAGPAVVGTALAGIASKGDPLAMTVGGLAGATAGAAAKGTVREILMSPLGRRYLANQALGIKPRTPAELGIAIALTNAGTHVSIPDISGDSDEIALPR